MARRLLPASLAFVLSASAPAALVHAETTVPLELQVDLMRRVVRFERGFASRAGEQVKFLLVTPGKGTAAPQLGKALEDAKEIAGKPIRISTHRFSTAAALKGAVAKEGAQIVYLSPGLEAEMSAIAAALGGVPVITISTDGDQVERGAVLGFELVSARPKIVLNLGQARRQGLDFNSDLFRLARIIK
jgi:hypothetical protein